MSIMIMIKNAIKRLIWPNYYCSEALVRYLQNHGASIGEGTYFIAPRDTVVDLNGRFIVIDKHCCITSGVVILSHDWSYSIVARVYNDAPGGQRMTRIGDNVFIGMNSVILMGADIGDNVIIGAGSIVSGKIESNSVYAGNPAKKLCSLEEYYYKLKSHFEESALLTIERMELHDGRTPELSELGLYASLFVEKTPENMKRYFSCSKIPFAIEKMEKKFNTYDELREFVKMRHGVKE